MDDLVKHAGGGDFAPVWLAEKRGLVAALLGGL